MTSIDVLRIQGTFSRLCLRLALTAALVLATACRGNKDLGAGFRLIWMNGCEVRIARQSSGPAPEVVIAGSIQSYAVSRQYITGYADLRCIDRTSEPQAQPGYFLIDTKSGDIHQSMDEEMAKRSGKGWMAGSSSQRAAKNESRLRRVARPSFAWAGMSCSSPMGTVSESPTIREIKDGRINPSCYNLHLSRPVS